MDYKEHQKWIDKLYGDIADLKRERDKLEQKLKKQNSVVAIVQALTKQLAGLATKLDIRRADFVRMRNTLIRLDNGPHVWIDSTQSKMSPHKPPMTQWMSGWTRYTSNPEGHPGYGIAAVLDGK